MALGEENIIIWKVGRYPGFYTTSRNTLCETLRYIVFRCTHINAYKSCFSGEE